MRPLYIVPCSQTKSRVLASQAMPAKEAYMGQAFQCCRRILERHRLQWCILSGYYGFLWPTTLIENYDVKMRPVTPSTCWDDCFGHINNRQYARLMAATDLTCLGSRLYVDAAAILLGRPVAAPVAGLSIGHMLSARPPSPAGFFVSSLNIHTTPSHEHPNHHLSIQRFRRSYRHLESRRKKTGWCPFRSGHLASAA
jgi:hypothetical protein